LFGGNLEMLARSVGILPLDLASHIVLLEINKAAGLGMVDRALCQLVLSGALDGIAGIALGRASGFEAHQDRGWTILDVLHEHLDRFEVPILGGLPIGHGADPWFVPLNVPCRLDTAGRTLTTSPLYG
jgi:muramoyltetrapeptide carboxypeptidase